MVNYYFVIQSYFILKLINNNQWFKIVNISKFYPVFLSLLIALLIICFNPKVTFTQNILGNSSPYVLAQNTDKILKKGTEIMINDQIYSLPWLQWQEGNSSHIGISDVGAEAILGIKLLSTNQPKIQPINWFSYYKKLPTKFVNPYRYLDLNEFVKLTKIKLKIEGDYLKFDLPFISIKKVSKISDINGEKIVIELNRPSFWQFSQGREQGIIKIIGQATSDLIEEFDSIQPIENLIEKDTIPHGENKEEDEGDTLPGMEKKEEDTPLFTIENEQNNALITINIPQGNRLAINSTNPNLLLVDIKPDAMIEREITWTPEIFWQQKYIDLTKDLITEKNDHEVALRDRFFVSFLTVNVDDFKLDLRPITTNKNTMMGTAPLTKTAQNNGALIAINGGFFNRKNQLPLGAIKSKEKWLSGPILNRGVIAWNDVGDFKIDRLKLEEIITTSKGDRFIINYLNSAFLEKGISRYTPQWGLTYTTLTDNEIIILVENEKIKEQIICEKAGENSIKIPPQGYLLTIRNAEELAPKFEVDNTLILKSKTIPEEFANYPSIMGAGPLLLLDRQIVLDGKAERFSNAFNEQKASRSAIATTSDGKLLLVAVHNRVGGKGPSLLELAKILQSLGAIDALNLDGGSSTQIYLGGHIIDRSPNTAARVHNGIGFFLLLDSSRY